VNCQRLNAERVHSSQLCRLTPSNVMVQRVVVLEHVGSYFGPEAICPVLFEDFCHSSNENLKLTPQINKALFRPYHLKFIKHTKYIFHCATCRKVAGSIPDGVMKFFIDLILLVTLWP
jgi:hypothetical protein